MTITEDPAPPSGSAPDTPTPSSGWSRNQRALAVLVVLLVAALAVFVVTKDDDSPAANLPPAGDAPTLPPVASVPPDAEGTALLELIEKGQEATFHAVFRSAGDPSVRVADTIEVWRKGGKIRNDTTSTQTNQTNRTATLSVEDGKTTACQKLGDLPWTCADAITQGSGEGGLFATPASELGGADVVQSAETVEGHAAQCFSFQRDGGTVKLCVDDDGVPLSQSAAGQEFVISELSSDVDDSVFTPPSTS